MSSYIDVGTSERPVQGLARSRALILVSYITWLVFPFTFFTDITLVDCVDCGICKTFVYVSLSPRFSMRRMRSLS